MCVTSVSTMFNIFLFLKIPFGLKPGYLNKHLMQSAFDLKLIVFGDLHFSLQKNS